jgi:hypothetical protein
VNVEIAGTPGAIPELQVDNLGFAIINPRITSQLDRMERMIQLIGALVTELNDLFRGTLIDVSSIREDVSHLREVNG